MFGRDTTTFLSRTNRAAASWFAILALCLLLFACAASSTPGYRHAATTPSADESRIAYGVNGQGETAIVFIHGWLCDHTVWRHQIHHFSKSHEVVWLDLAGHGDSTANRERFTMSAFARDVVAVVEAVDAQKVILVGHSMGGPIAIEAAHLLGDKVAAIVGVDAFYTPLAAVPEEMKLKFVDTLKADYPKALKGTVLSMFSEHAGRDAIESTYDNMLAHDRNMGVSALYECIKWNSGEEPRELRRYAAKLYNINGAPTGKEINMHDSVVLIQGVGHFVPLRKPDEFNAALELIVERY